MCLLFCYIQVKRLIFIDESGFETNMRRSYGWCKKENRLYEHKSNYKSKRLNVLGAISERGMEHYEIHDKSVNGEIFCAFLRNLCQKIPKNP